MSRLKGTFDGWIRVWRSFDGCSRVSEMAIIFSTSGVMFALLRLLVYLRESVFELLLRSWETLGIVLTPVEVVGKREKHRIINESPGRVPSPCCFSTVTELPL